MAVAAATSNGEFHGSSIYDWFIVENTVNLMNMDDTWDGWLITENSIKT